MTKLLYIANARIPTEKAHGIQIMKMCEAFASARIDTDSGRIFTDEEKIVTDKERINADNLRGSAENLRKSGLLYEDLTYKTRGAVFNVYNTLGFGHKESIYQKALEHELRKNGMTIEPQKSVNLMYDGERVGTYKPDLIVENKIILELKSSRFLVETDKEQILHYLKGTDYKLALLINFGSSKLQIERIIHTTDYPRESEVNQRKSESIEVELVVPTRINFIKKDPFTYYGAKQNFKITRLRTLDPNWLQYFGNGFYIKVQAAFFMISLYFYLKEAIRENQSINPSESVVLYTRDEYLLPVLQRFTPGGVVWEAHNLPMHKDYYLKYWKNCQKIITISRGLKDELVKLGIEENKITIAPDGVDLEKFKVESEKSKVRGELGLPLEKKIVIYTGHLYDWKGAGTLLEAARIYTDEERIGTDKSISGNPQTDPRQSVLFVFVGGTEDDIKKFKKQAQGLDNVLILGHKPHSDIPKYLLAADVLVLPNSAKAPISRFYTSPLKMFEYMAAGIPIVASSLPSTREVLNQENAVLVEPDNPKALAEGIGHVLRNPDLAGKISRESLKDAQKYSWKQRAKILLEGTT